MAQGERNLARRVANRAVRRRFVAALIARSGVGLLWASVSVLGLVGGCKVFGREADLRLAVGILLVGLAVGVVWAWIERWDEARGARELDRSLGLKDAISSGLAFEGASEGFARLAVAASEEHARGVDVRRAVPIRGTRAQAWWPLVAAMAAGVWWFVPGVERGDGLARVEDAELVREASAALARASEVVERLGPTPGGVIEDASAVIADLERELAGGCTDPATALAQGAEAMDSIAGRAAQDALESARAMSRLREVAARSQGIGDDRAARLARAIAKGEYEQAAAEAAKLRNDAPGMTREERERIAQNLEAMARAMTDPPEATNELHRTAPEGDASEPGAGAKPPKAGEAKEPRDGGGEPKPPEPQADRTPDSASTPRDPKPEESEQEPRQASTDGTPPSGESTKGADTPREGGAREKRTPTDRASEALKQAAEELRRPKTAQERGEGRPGERSKPPRDASPKQGVGETQTPRKEAGGDRRPEPGGRTGAAGQERKDGEAREGAAPSGKESERTASNPREAKPERGEGREQGPTPTQGSPDAGTTTPTPAAAPSPGQGTQKREPGREGEAARTEQGEANGRKGEPPTQGLRPGEVGKEGQPSGKAPAPEGQTPKLAREESLKEGSPSGGAERGMKEDEMPRIEPGAGEAPAPGDPEPNTEGLSEQGLERLENEMRRFAEQGKQIDRRLLESKTLREQAQRMLEKATPRQRERLEDLAREIAGKMDAGERGERGGAVRPATPRRDLDQVPTTPVDARGEKADGTGPTIAEWMSEAGEGMAARERLAEGVRRAAQGVERSIEQQSVPARYEAYVRRVFERYVKRAQSGEPAAAPPAALPDAPDAKPR